MHPHRWRSSDGPQAFAARWRAAAMPSLEAEDWPRRRDYLEGMTARSRSRYQIVAIGSQHTGFAQECVMSDSTRKACLKRYHANAVARQQRAKTLHTFTVAYRCKKRREQLAKRKAAAAELHELKKTYVHPHKR